MAELMELGSLRVRTMTPDELAMLARYAVQHGLHASPEEASKVRAAVVRLIPVLPLASRALVIEAIPAAEPGWLALRAALAE